MQNLREYGTFGQVEVPEPIFEKTFSTEGPKVGPGGAQGRPQAAPRSFQGGIFTPPMRFQCFYVKM